MSYHLDPTSTEPTFCPDTYKCKITTPEFHYGSISEAVRERNIEILKIANLAKLQQI